MAEPGRLWIGTSGYQYRHWKGVFYPDKLPQRHWLAYYMEHFDTVEINASFYALPSESTFESWRRRAEPRRPGFLFTLKFSRYGSHLKRLLEPEQTIGLFLDHAEHLRQTMGVILVQLSPRWAVDPDRLARFLDARPQRHRWAVEFRNPTWLREDVYEILSSRGAALCIHDHIHEHPHVLTADWVYLRYHGAQTGGDYPTDALQREATMIAGHLRRGRDVYAYFNNDIGGHAIHNAQDLRAMVACRVPTAVTTG